MTVFSSKPSLGQRFFSPPSHRACGFHRTRRSIANRFTAHAHRPREHRFCSLRLYAGTAVTTMPLPSAFFQKHHWYYGLLPPKFTSHFLPVQSLRLNAFSLCLGFNCSVCSILLLSRDSLRLFPVKRSFFHCRRKQNARSFFGRRSGNGPTLAAKLNQSAAFCAFTGVSYGGSR